MARLFNNYSRTIDSPQRVAQDMSDAAKYGLTRIGFVTDPNETR